MTRTGSIRNSGGGDTGPRREMALGKTVGAVANAVTILRALARAHEPKGATRIARETGINASTCFNILRTLEAEDLVAFDPVSKSYSISLGLMEIALSASVVGNDINAVRPLMNEVSLANGVTLAIWQPVRRDRMVLIATSLAPNTIRVQMAVGQRLPLVIGSGGRCFAAFSDLTRDEVEQLFSQIRWQLPLEFDRYWQEVEEARRNGFAIDNEYFAAGVVTVGVPVLGEDGKAVLAITATLLKGQYANIRCEKLVSDLKRLATQVQRVMAGPG